ncbi:MAG TPA: tRNA pseudouridine(38-40) synthase TruA [Bacillus bacterium]|uniref:tRNA pseudouridine synthase A n=1 Tax=Siminovitchia fordii TaxID=254759 RepID=A0ABQ4KAN7_9BACI|nr:tRNA pseudouridine(38-40) synthase TruA [Siminovitchia fordii]GIN22792.1 tRNA pseudouridine synthase A 1 [Siminovitchia fordii]HBZ11328.1 tRNA pseudouridine(38-40) synthase TruA [Bacillus sp. (in: firmicutes)]
MQRYKATVSYDGSGFTGYQIQPKGRTVQGEIEQVLRKLHKGQAVGVTASGRTDSGVHARGQVIHFDSPLKLSGDQWIKACNSLLPDDISFSKVEEAGSNFHARFDAVQKKYKYFLYGGPIRDPFRRHFAAHIRGSLDVKSMRRAADCLKGTHDFSSFCSAKTETDNKVRTLFELEIEEQGRELVLTFVGDGFLYNMVRIIVGTLLDVGSGKLDIDAIPDILSAKDRTMAGKTAPAEGLYLWEVFYENGK